MKGEGRPILEGMLQGWIALGGFFLWDLVGMVRVRPGKSRRGPSSKMACSSAALANVIRRERAQVGVGTLNLDFDFNVYFGFNLDTSSASTHRFCRPKRLKFSFMSTHSSRQNRSFRKLSSFRL